MQRTESASAGQALPLCFGCTRMLRVRVSKPPPQVAVHADTRDQPDTTQSMGQGRVAHGIVLVRALSEGQALPPPEAWRSTARTHVCFPPPHVRSQAPLEQSQSPSWQSCGAQGAVLHCCVRYILLGHAMPPPDAGRSTRRAHSCTPPPHGEVHSPQNPQSDILQSTAAEAAGATRATTRRARIGKPRRGHTNLPSSQQVRR